MCSHAGLGQGIRRRCARGENKGKQQPLRRDEAVAGLVRYFLRAFEQLRHFRRQINLRRAGSFYLGNPGKRRIELHAGDSGVAPRRRDQVGCKAFLVVEKHLQQVLGLEMLMIVCERRRLCRLHKSTRPFGIGLKFHYLQLHFQTLQQTPPLCGRPMSGPGSRRPIQIWEIFKILQAPHRVR